jgi:hypothetical protein
VISDACFFEFGGVQVPSSQKAYAAFGSDGVARDPNFRSAPRHVIWSFVMPDSDQQLEIEAPEELLADCLCRPKRRHSFSAAFLLS